MKLSIVVAHSLNQVIGIQNQLPWHLPADLKYFKQLTQGHCIVMGRKTFESIGKPLPNRENIILSRNENFKPEGTIAFQTIEEVLEYCKNKNEEIFIIGGEIIFNLLMPFANKIYRTLVHTEIEHGDAFFIILNKDEWKVVSSDFHSKDEKNIFDYTFEVLEKK